MTTKKERRARVAAKRAEFDAETRRMGLEAQARDRARRESKAYEAERVEQSKKRALAMRKAHEAKTNEVPENLRASYENVSDLTVGELLERIED